MKVAYLNPSAQLGGAEAALLNVLAALRITQPSWELTLITSEDGPLIGRAEALGIPTRVEPMPEAVARLGDAAVAGLGGAGKVAASLLGASPAVMSYLRTLRRVLAELSPDVVHTNGFKMHVLGSRAAPAAAAVVWHVHDFVSRRKLMSHVLKAHASRVACAITNSQSVADDLRRLCGETVRITPILNAIDLQRFTPDGPALDLDRLADLPPAEGEVTRIGMLATMARWKGHEVFLRALALMTTDISWRAYFIGGPIYRTQGSEVKLEDLEVLRNVLGLSGRVGFTGFVSDAPSAIRALDVVVHASTEPEPFGLVIAEALACGRAVIAAEGGGASEILAKVEGAVGSPAGDASALAKRIAELIGDREALRELGRRGRASVGKHFDSVRLGPQFAEIYLQAVAG